MNGDYDVWVYPNPNDRSVREPRWLLWLIGHLYYAYVGDQPNEEPRNCVAHGRTAQQARERAYTHLAARRQDRWDQP